MKDEGLQKVPCCDHLEDTCRHSLLSIWSLLAFCNLLQIFVFHKLCIPTNFHSHSLKVKKKKTRRQLFQRNFIFPKVAPVSGTGQPADFRPSTKYSYEIALAGCHSKLHHRAGQSSSVVVARVWETHSRRLGVRSQRSASIPACIPNLPAH